MVRPLLTGLVGLSILGASLLAQPPKGKEPPPPPKETKGTETPPKDAPKDKGNDAPPPAKDEKPKTPPPTPGKPVAGVFKTKDLEKQTLTMTEAGKDRTFKVTKDTKFLGPKGARSDDRLKDDRLDKGYKVVVVPDAEDEATALEVKLSSRADRDK